MEVCLEAIAKAWENAKYKSLLTNAKMALNQFGYKAPIEIKLTLTGLGDGFTWETQNRERHRKL